MLESLLRIYQGMSWSKHVPGNSIEEYIRDIDLEYSSTFKLCINEQDSLVYCQLLARQSACDKNYEYSCVHDLEENITSYFIIKEWMASSIF